MCSTGHYRGAQWEFRCTMGSYVLNWTLLECLMWIYNLLNWTLLGCSMGIQVLNGNLGAQWEFMWSTGHYWSPQWEFRCSMGSAPWEINGVHIVVVVNNIYSMSNHPLQEYSHTRIWCVVSAWKAWLNWELCNPLDTRNRTWDWKTEAERSEVKFFVILWKHVMGLGIEKLKLSAAKWSVLSYYENM